MSEDVEFAVHGIPAPQGSKVRTRQGFLREDNRNTIPWRNAVAAAALEAMNGEPPMVGPLRLEAVFHFPRPASHYRTGQHAGQLKASAPVFCRTRPDLDKLLRALGDAMVGIVYHDDAQIAVTLAWKYYGRPGVRVRVLPIFLRSVDAPGGVADGYEGGHRQAPAQPTLALVEPDYQDSTMPTPRRSVMETPAPPTPEPDQPQPDDDDGDEE